MQIEIHKADKMTFSGDKIVTKGKHSFPQALDALVRESIQNSLDAEDPSAKGNSVDVDFITTEFDMDALESNLECFSLSRGDYNKKTALIIRDKNTTGISGDCYDRDSNFYKLVFDLENAQSTEGSGGSHGIGKALFYKAGIGIVIYYTRTKNKRGELLSRLIVCYVEGEHTNHLELDICDESSYLGISWWGTLNSENKVMPINDENEINKFLEIFTDFTPFLDDETGTAVIIPFINKTHLMSNSNSIKWFNSIDSYLKIAIQRWYCLRLNNRNFNGGRFLKVTVNGERVKNEYSLFKELQELYNNNFSVEKNDKFVIKEIKVNGVSGPAGYFSYEIIDKKQLIEDNINEPIPNLLIYNESNPESNFPIIVYNRKPGMIINYNKGIIRNIPSVPDNKYVIGVFSLKGDSNLFYKSLSSKITINGAKNLEELFRISENNVHESWESIHLLCSDDINHKIDCATRIQSKVTSILNSELAEEDKENNNHENITNRYSREIGACLMPNDDLNTKTYSYGGIGGAGGVGGIGKAKGKKNNKSLPQKPKTKHTAEVEITPNLSKLTAFDRNGNITCYNKLYIPSGDHTFEICLNLGSERIGSKDSKNDLSSYKYWENESLEFPIKIKKLKIYPEDNILNNYIEINKIYKINNLSVLFDSNVIKIDSNSKYDITYDLLISYSVKGLYSAEVVLKKGKSHE